MSKIIVYEQKCKGCQLCIVACPKKNIRLSKEINKKSYHYAQIIDMQKCNACGFCYQMCPDVAIEVWK